MRERLAVRQSAITFHSNPSTYGHRLSGSISYPFRFTYTTSESLQVVRSQGMGQQDGFYHDPYDPEDVNHALFQDVLESHIGEDGDIWIFGFGSLLHTPGFGYSDVVKGYIKGFKRVWWQGSTDHRGTVERPGRTVTLIRDADSVTYGVAYKLDGDLEQQKETLKYLEWREKQYDHREYVDVYAAVEDEEPVLREVLCYIATDNTEANPNYLGPASMEDLAVQIAGAVGPSGPNSEYLFKMEEALQHVRESDEDLFVLADRVRDILRDE